MHSPAKVVNSIYSSSRAFLSSVKIFRGCFGVICGSCCFIREIIFVTNDFFYSSSRSSVAHKLTFFLSPFSPAFLARRGPRENFRLTVDDAEKDGRKLELECDQDFRKSTRNNILAMTKQEVQDSVEEKEKWKSFYFFARIFLLFNFHKVKSAHFGTWI